MTEVNFTRTVAAPDTSDSAACTELAKYALVLVQEVVLNPAVQAPHSPVIRVVSVQVLELVQMVALVLPTCRSCQRPFGTCSGGAGNASMQ